ncbi:hypothetical protein GCM10009836_72710 [Pseudonocardia ailaonensis]|uniref:DUF4397 domain-containing protein n=1 Tax=Pseudonocardia ailaonensis TaxID=367279 RepID=A0ABN2NPM8_9PSEU
MTGARIRKTLLAVGSGAGLVLAAVLALVLATPAAAAPAPAAPAPGTAFVRLAHLSPDTPRVDVYLSPQGGGPQLVERGVAYGDVSTYRSLPTGEYTVAMRRAGAAADGPPIIATTLAAQPDQAYTVAGTGPYAGLGLKVLDDDLRAPAPGTANIRIVNAAASATRTDVAVAGGPSLVTGLPFASTGEYRAVPGGAWTLDVTAPGRTPQTVPATVSPGSTYSVLLLDDGSGGFRAELHRDSVGATIVPAGGVETGGTAVPVTAARATETPTAVRIPKLGVDQRLTSLGLDPAGAMQVPDSANDIGWFRDGAVPGDPGPAVLAAHVDLGHRAGAFTALRTLTAGDTVEVTRADGTTAVFAVTDVTTVDKDAFPTDQVFGPTPLSRLTLVTCGGTLDRSAGRYLSNVLVRAELLTVMHA